MSEQELVAARAAGEDVLGRRGFFANVDRARAFGANSLSGMLDIVAGIVIVGAWATVGVLLIARPIGQDDGSNTLIAALVACGGVTCGLILMAMSRLVTYAKACAVLLAQMSFEPGAHHD